MGYPSRACEACRRRKIGCDLERPDCSNCRLAGWKCSGYRDLSSLVILHETGQKGKRPRKERTKLNKDSKVDSMAFERSSGAKIKSKTESDPCSDGVRRSRAKVLDFGSHAAPIPIAASLDFPCAIYAETFFMKSLITVPTYKHGIPLLPICLPDIYNTSLSSSALHQAFRATSIMGLARASGYSQSTVRAAIIEHGRALRSFCTLLELDNCPDKIMLCGSLLILYEILSSGGDVNDRYSVHMNGIAAWIKQNADRSSWTPKSLQLHNVFRLAFLEHCIYDSKPVDSSFQLAESEIAELSTTSGSLKPLIVGFRLATLRTRAKHVLGYTGSTRESSCTTKNQISATLELLRDASDMEGEFSIWFSAFQGSIERGDAENVLNMELLHITHTELQHRNPLLGHYLNDCRVFQIYMVDTVIRSLKSLRSLYDKFYGKKFEFVEQLYETSQKRLQKYIEDLFSATGRILLCNESEKSREMAFSTKAVRDSINGWGMTRKLSEALKVDSITETQRLKFGEQIRVLNAMCM